MGKVVLAPVVAAAKNRAACSKALPATVHLITHLTPPCRLALQIADTTDFGQRKIFAIRKRQMNSALILLRHQPLTEVSGMVGCWFCVTCQQEYEASQERSDKSDVKVATTRLKGSRHCWLLCMSLIVTEFSLSSSSPKIRTNLAPSLSAYRICAFKLLDR